MFEQTLLPGCVWFHHLPADHPGFITHKSSDCDPDLTYRWVHHLCFLNGCGGIEEGPKSFHCLRTSPGQQTRPTDSPPPSPAARATWLASNCSQYIRICLPFAFVFCQWIELTVRWWVDSSVLLFTWEHEHSVDDWLPACCHVHWWTPLRLRLRRLFLAATRLQVSLLLL